jgi:MICOS complex subunit MIC12
MHRSNRLNQSLQLHQSSLILRNAIDPLPPAPEPSAREARVSLTESAKDRWNTEVEGLVRRIQTTDWDGVRDGVLERVASVYKTSKQAVQSVGSSESVREMEKNAPLPTATKREG